MSARLEAAIAAQGVELSALRELCDQLRATVEAQAGELGSLSELVQSQGARLGKAAEWATFAARSLADSDQALDELAADLSLAEFHIYGLCEWHATLAAAVPGFAEAHPLDPMLAVAKRNEARRAASAGSGANPFDAAVRRRVWASLPASGDVGGDDGRQPG